MWCSIYFKITALLQTTLIIYIYIYYKVSPYKVSTGTVLAQGVVRISMWSVTGTINTTKAMKSNGTVFSAS